MHVRDYSPDFKTWLQAIIGKLKAKRFRQIFDYLDTAGAGELDLVTLVSAPACSSQCLDRTCPALLQRSRSPSRAAVCQVAPPGRWE